MKKTIIEDQTGQDHDTLIRVETKVDSLVETINDLKSGMIARMVKVESRLDAIDLYHAGVPLKEYDENSKWLTSYRANLDLEDKQRSRKYLLFVMLASLSSGLIVVIVQHLLHF